MRGNLWNVPKHHHFSNASRKEATMPTKREAGAALEFYGVASGKMDIADCKYLGKQRLQHPEDREPAERSKSSAERRRAKNGKAKPR